jgi:hypothetical protein
MNMRPMLRRSTGWSFSAGRQHLAVERRRRRVHVPALDAEAVGQALHGDRLGDVRVFLRAAQRLGVHEGQVGEVGQVVDDQHPVGVVVHVVGHALPLRVAQVGEVDDQVGVRLGRLAHPDPHQVVLLDHRIALHAKLGGHLVLARDLDALAGGIELQPVVHAAHAVALAPSQVQRHAAMAAAVTQRHHLAALGLVQQHAFFQDGARQHLAVQEFVVPGGDVPAVLQKHGEAPVDGTILEEGLPRSNGRRWPLCSES